MRTANSDDAQQFSSSQGVAAAVPVAAGIVALGDGSGLPTDLVYPTELAERAAGSNAFYSPMTETFWRRRRNLELR